MDRDTLDKAKQLEAAFDQVDVVLSALERPANNFLHFGGYATDEIMKVENAANKLKKLEQLIIELKKKTMNEIKEDLKQQFLDL